MPTVVSKDGTVIAYDRVGQGPPVILVDGALGYRALGFTADLARELAPHFTVYDYDRRGRGDSGNTLPFSVEREVEDIDALIREAGGAACVYGISSGACLALEAASRLGRAVKKLALYEPPYWSDPGALEEWRQYLADISKAISEGRRGAAVARFMQIVRTPPEMIAGMRQSPAWPMLEAVAPTLEYDAAAMGKDRTAPIERAACVTAQTLVMNGEDPAFPFMDTTAAALAEAIPHAVHRVLTGQTHNVSSQALAPVLIEFFNAG